MHVDFVRVILLSRSFFGDYYCRIGCCCPSFTRGSVNGWGPNGMPIVQRGAAGVKNTPWSLSDRLLADLNRFFSEDFALQSHYDAANRYLARGAAGGIDDLPQESAAAGDLHDHDSDGMDLRFIY
jgi:hypothetical protein